MATITKPRTITVEVVFNKLKNTQYTIAFTGYYIPGEDATRDDDATPSEFEITKAEWVSGDPMDFHDDNLSTEEINDKIINHIEQ